MKELIVNMTGKFGLFILGGLIGAIIHRFRNQMSWKRFLSTLVISAFMGFCVGILLKEYLGAKEEVIFVACSLTGVFSNDILDQLNEIIDYLSTFIKGFLNKKTK